MDVAIFALILIGLAAFVATPLYRPTRQETDVSPDNARQEAITRALRDLELDRASGLVDEASYQRERAALDRQAHARGD